MAPRHRQPFRHKESVVLQALYHLNSKQRKALLQKSDNKLVRHICECALNVLVGNVPLDKRHKSKLRKHASILRTLAEPRVSLCKKKKLIIQRGGFLPALLAPIIGTVLASLIGK